MDIGKQFSNSADPTHWRFCTSLLKPDGRCEQMLPSTYGVWRAQVNEQCGAREHEAMIYASARDAEDVVSLTEVNFANHLEYEKTVGWGFALFLWIRHAFGGAPGGDPLFVFLATRAVTRS